MKRSSTIVGLLLATVCLAAGAAEPPDSDAKGLTHDTLKVPKDPRDGSDEKEWRDVESSDPGTTLLDYGKSQQQVERQPAPLEQANPNVERAAERDKTVPVDRSSKKRPSDSQQVEVLDRSESVRKLKEKSSVPDARDPRVPKNRQ
ncbi:MAG: hypothetical protein KJO31_11745 [Gammaproteobacteria bacterium]|nr:hypothetical protein [Gammaproteobacteria bacterium]